MVESTVRHLRQGELYFGRDAGMLRTLLGSCVAIVLWHEQKKLSGMCHIVLPDSAQMGIGCDDRFADCAIDSFVEQIKASGTRPGEYWVGVYGGGNMFPGIPLQNFNPVGEQNVSAVCRRLKQYGFHVAHKDIGGTAYRSLSLDMESGEVLLRNTDVPVNS